MDVCDTRPPFGAYSPTRLIDDMQWLLAGIVTSTIVYGFNVMVAILCLLTLLKGRKEDGSKGRLGALSVYIIVMLGLATAAVVYSNLAVAEFAKVMVLGTPHTISCATGLFSNLVLEVESAHLYNLVVPPSLPVTIWAADGILIWRCLVLYQAVSLPKKRILYVTLALLASFSLGSGGYSFWNPANSSAEWTSLTGQFEVNGGDIALQAARQLVLPSTIAINTLVAGLIAARLLYNSESPYITALEICVESSAMIVLWAAVSLMTTSIPDVDDQGALWNYSGGYLIPIVIFPQICVISPLLIIYRVARRRRNDPITALEDNLTHMSMAFYHSQPNDTILDSRA